MNYYAPLISDNYYHIFNRAVGKERLFLGDEDYLVFLEKYREYINPVADTFAYSLLPNHFHFQIQIKSYEDVLQYFEEKKPALKIYDGWQPKFVMQQFSNLFNCYTKKTNHKYNRKGALFMDYMKRLLIETDNQFAATLFYIHKNPVHHNCSTKMNNWKWSSFNAITSNAPTDIQRQKVIDFFGGVKQYIEYHQQPIHLKNARIIDL